MAKSRWYIIHAYSGYEAKVADAIKAQAILQELDALVDDVIVPTEEVIEIRKGKKVTSEKKFFPGYVLIKMVMTDDTYHLVNAHAKVTGFLGQQGRPSPI
ncbi:MAG: transcription termination/antitermination protein NusG, partial [Kordiimonadales bacterium]